MRKFLDKAIPLIGVTSYSIIFVLFCMNFYEPSRVMLGASILIFPVFIILTEISHNTIEGYKEITNSYEKILKDTIKILETKLPKDEQ